MKLFTHKSKKDKMESGKLDNAGFACSHPVSHQIPLYEDSSDSHRMTGIKCTQCGERVPMPEKVA